VVNITTVGVNTATGLSRGVDVLIALSEEGAARSGGLGVVQIAELIGQEKSQVSRTLKTLAGSGLVERHPDTRGYRLGWRLFSLAAQAGDQRLLEAAPPVLATLMDELGETVHLSVLRGVDVLTVLSESPLRAIQAEGWVGHTVPAYCSSAGRALLVDLDRDALRSLFAGTEFRRLAPSTTSNVDELARRVAKARTRGYAIVEEELEPGLVGAAAPVRDFTGRVAAALNVSAPTFRYAGKLDAAGRTIRAAADRLSLVLGQGVAGEAS
jgi:IclR family transcriptional regulator, KDG regulon repressor